MKDYSNYWSRKIVLVDYDGVLADFTQAFDVFMHELGYCITSVNQYNLITRYADVMPSTVLEYIEEFVHSDEMTHLPACYDSIQGIRNLRDNGFVFHCITSYPEKQRQNRILNAKYLFGTDFLFQRLHCVGLNSDKHEVLKLYKDTGCIWIEDKPENAVIGLDYGLVPLLVHHEYNSEFSHDGVIRVYNWTEIEDIVIMNEIERFREHPSAIQNLNRLNHLLLT